MSEGYYELAEKLAARPYFVMKLRDETTEGRLVYLARALEIENCFGQGDTPEEAEEDLRSALVDFIEGLLEDGMYVPEPARLVKTTGGTSADLTTTITNPHAYTINLSGDNSYILSIHA
jgi:predicted RNase H-like HicB family nuclease